MNKRAKHILSCVGLLAVFSAQDSLAAAQLPTEIRIPGEYLVPESLTSANDGSVYIGSITKGMVFRAAPGSADAKPWIGPGIEGMPSVLGVFADDKSKTLWVCARPLAGATPAGSTPVRSAVFAFDLKTGKLKQRYPLPNSDGSCNDMAVDQNETLYVTDSNNMQVLRLRKGADELGVWSYGQYGARDGRVDGIAVIGHTVYVNTINSGKLFAVEIGADGKAGPVIEVKLNRPLERPDGMRSIASNTILTVERSPVGKVSRIDLNGTTGTVTVIKDGYLDDPDAVTMVGETAYVLEGQFKAMRPDPNYTPKPFHATALDINAK